MLFTYILLSFFTSAHCVPLRIELFSSQSFVPDDIKVTFSIEQSTYLDYNLTIEEQFPGKILMNVFVRQLFDVPGAPPNKNFMKFRNLDFCKALESVRNLTTEHVHGTHLIPKSFLSSCPLIPGFYYLKSAVVDLNALPNNIPDGRFFLLMELIQVYEEVTLLLNVKIKFLKYTPEGVNVSPVWLVHTKQSDEDEPEAEQDDAAGNEKKSDESDDAKDDQNKEEEEDDRQTTDNAEEQAKRDSAEEELDGQSEADSKQNEDNDEKQKEEEDEKEVEGEQQDKDDDTEQQEEQQEYEAEEETMTEAVSEAS